MPRTAARTFHPDLRAGRMIPPIGFGPRSLALPGPEGAPPVQVRLHRPVAPSAGPAPLVLWVHGGGLVSRTPVQDDGTAAGGVPN